MNLQLYYKSMALTPERKKIILIIGIILIALIVFASKRQQTSFSTTGMMPYDSGKDLYVEQSAPAQTGMAVGRSASKIAPDMMPIRPPDIAPAADVQNRMVIKETNLSLLVDDIRTVSDNIINHAKSVGGYMVNSTLETPGEAVTGTVSIRVPTEQLSEVLTYLRSLAIKVTSENLNGYDVTDQYVDNEARLATLNTTKEKFQAIMNQAKEISDITNIQRELINLQSQIDAIKGQQQYLEQSSKTSMIHVYLSTDDLSLPYAPDNAWRPGVVFKQAVRSLVLELRNGINFLIWLAVYAVIWVPALIIVYLIVKRLNRS